MCRYGAACEGVGVLKKGGGGGGGGVKDMIFILNPNHISLNF